MIVPHRNVLEKVASHQRSERGVRVSPPCTPPASPGIVRSRSPAEQAPSSASVPQVRLQQSASPARAATNPSSIQDSLYLVSTPDQGGRGEVSNSSSQLELLPSRNCRLQSSPPPSNLGSPCLSSSSPRPPARLGGASPGGLSGVSPRPPTPPPPPLLTAGHASPVQQRPSLASPPFKRQDALANSYQNQHAPNHPLDRVKDFPASETKSSGNRDFKTHVPNSSESQGPRDCRAESPLSVPCLKQRQYSPLPRLEGVDWGLPKPPPRPSPRKSPQPPSSTPGSPSFPKSLLATLARAKKVVGRGGQSPNLQTPPSDVLSHQTNVDTRRPSRSQQRPDSLIASQSPSPKVTEWRQKVERVRRQSQTSPLASPLSSPFASPLTSPKQSHPGPRQGQAGGLGHSQGVGSSMPEQLELAMSTTSSPRMRKDKQQGRARAQLARGKRPTSSSRESFVFIGCDGAVLARSGPDNERPVVRRVRMEGGSCQEVIASPKDEDREMERIQASHRLRQISDQLEATKCLRPDQMREVPFYPCNPYNQPSKEVKPRPISLATFPSPPNSPPTFHTPPSSPSTAVSARKRQVASKACADESEGSVLQKVQPPKLKQAGVQPGVGGVPSGLPLTKTNLKLMTVLSNSCTVFTGQVDCDNLITPELPVRKISHDLPYQACSEEDARRDFSKRNTVYKK